MAPTSLSERYPDADATTMLAHDTRILKSFMNKQYNSRKNRGEPSSRQVYASANPIPLECDIHTGCHRADDPTAGHESIATARESSKQRHEQQQGFSFSEEQRMQQFSLSGSDPVALDDYEQLEDLYRNCHHSKENRYSHLLDCSSHDHHRDARHDGHHDDHDHPKKYYHHLRLPEKDAAATQRMYYKSLKYPMHTTAQSANFMVECSPATLALVLVSLFLVAMMLVEMVGVLNRVVKSLSSSPNEQDENNRRERRRLRREKHAQHLVAVYEDSPAVEDEKPSEEICV